MSDSGGLTIRQFDREVVDLDVEFVIDEANRKQVGFSPSSSAPDRYRMLGRTTDLSSGGAGIVARQYLPRFCCGMLRILQPGTGDESAGSPRDVLFEHPVRVRRTVMASHEPTYNIGLAFVDAAPDLAERIRMILEDGLGRGGHADA